MCVVLIKVPIILETIIFCFCFFLWLFFFFFFFFFGGGGGGGGFIVNCKLLLHEGKQ